MIHINIYISWWCPSKPCYIYGTSWTNRRAKLTIATVPTFQQQNTETLAKFQSQRCPHGGGEVIGPHEFGPVPTFCPERWKCQSREDVSLKFCSALWSPHRTYTHVWPSVYVMFSLPMITYLVDKVACDVWSLDVCLKIRIRSLTTAWDRAASRSRLNLKEYQISNIPILTATETLFEVFLRIISHGHTVYTLIETLSLPTFT